MANFECPGCKHLVDETTKLCPNCDYNIKKYVKEMQKQAKKTGTKAFASSTITLSSVYDHENDEAAPQLDFLKIKAHEPLKQSDTANNSAAQPEVAPVNVAPVNVAPVQPAQPMQPMQAQPMQPMQAQPMQPMQAQPMQPMQAQPMQAQPMQSAQPVPTQAPQAAAPSNGPSPAVAAAMAVMAERKAAEEQAANANPQTASQQTAPAGGPSPAVLRAMQMMEEKKAAEAAAPIKPEVVPASAPVVEATPVPAPVVEATPVSAPVVEATPAPAPVVEVAPAPAPVEVTPVSEPVPAAVTPVPSVPTPESVQTSFNPNIPTPTPVPTPESVQASFNPNIPTPVPTPESVHASFNPNIPTPVPTPRPMAPGGNPMLSAGGGYGQPGMTPTPVPMPRPMAPGGNPMLAGGGVSNPMNMTPMPGGQRSNPMPPFMQQKRERPKPEKKPYSINGPLETHEEDKKEENGEKSLFDSPFLNQRAKQLEEGVAPPLVSALDPSNQGPAAAAYTAAPGQTASLYANGAPGPMVPRPGVPFVPPRAPQPQRPKFNIADRFAEDDGPKEEKLFDSPALNAMAKKIASGEIVQPGSFQENNMYQSPMGQYGMPQQQGTPGYAFNPLAAQGMQQGYAQQPVYPQQAGYAAQPGYAFNPLAAQGAQQMQQGYAPQQAGYVMPGLNPMAPTPTPMTQPVNNPNGQQ